MNRIRLFDELTNEAEAINWCQNHHLLIRNLKCMKCQGPTKYNEENKVFRCRRNGCQKRMSITAGTVFHNTRIDIRTHVFLLYEWCIEPRPENLAWEYDVSLQTVYNLFKKYRNLASIFYLLKSDYNRWSK